LIADLKDEDDGVRGRAAWALGKIEDSRAVEALIAALKDEDDGVRESAAWALGDIGDSRAVKALIAALKDEDDGVRRSAAWVLGNLDYNPPVPDPRLPISFGEWVIKQAKSLFGIFKKYMGTLIVGLVTWVGNLILKVSIDKEVIDNTWPGVAKLIVAHPLRTALFAIALAAIVETFFKGSKD